jgi:DNA-binding Lrp family transcriptional regulator
LDKILKGKEIIKKIKVELDHYRLGFTEDALTAMGAGEMAQQLRAITALPEVLS